MEPQLVLKMTIPISDTSCLPRETECQEVTQSFNLPEEYSSNYSSSSSFCGDVDLSFNSSSGSAREEASSDNKNNLLDSLEQIPPLGKADDDDQILSLSSLRSDSFRRRLREAKLRSKFCQSLLDLTNIVADIERGLVGEGVVVVEDDEIPGVGGRDIDGARMEVVRIERTQVQRPQFAHKIVTEINQHSGSNAEDLRKKKR